MKELFKIKTLEDEYQNLYVKEQRDIMVMIPGLIDRNKYKFILKTNNESIIHHNTIDATKTFFSHNYVCWYTKNRVLY